MANAIITFTCPSCQKAPTQTVHLTTEDRCYCEPCNRRWTIYVNAQVTKELQDEIEELKQALSGLARAFARILKDQK